MSKAMKDQMGRDVLAQTGEKPCIILVRPQLGENIGAAARVMLNFGLTELRLIAPRDGWPNPSAEPMAAGAVNVLENATVYKDTADAVADLHFVLAATARRRELEIPVIGTKYVGDIVREKLGAGLKCGVMFGPEKAGLTNDDVVLADHILTYPINPAFQSLNLAQAVAVFASLWGMSANSEMPEVFLQKQDMPAKKEDILRMFEHLEAELERAGFFHPPEKKALMRRNIRAPFSRAKMTEQEIRTMRGIIKALAKGRGQGGKSD